MSVVNLSHVSLSEGVLHALVVVHALELEFRSGTFQNGAGLSLRPLPEEQDGDAEQERDAFEDTATGAEFWERNSSFFMAFEHCEANDLNELKSFLCTAESAQWYTEVTSPWEAKYGTLTLTAHVSGHRLIVWECYGF